MEDIDRMYWEWKRLESQQKAWAPFLWTMIIGVPVIAVVFLCWVYFTS